jgi:hypothetical protein
MTPADRYDALLRAGTPRAAESPARWTELALQARIYAGEFGQVWTGEDGETVEVLHFGEWNREPGPDFCRARLRLGGVEVQGDIEVDPDVRDWENHHHGTNPAYNGVVLHLFFRKGPRRFFTRTSEHRGVTQVCLAGGAPLRTVLPPATGPLDEAAARTLIAAAAEFRLRKKAARFESAARLGGRDEALFQMIATGLGYKNNKIPFLLVAQRVGLRRAARPDGEARLFGLAGFLAAEDFERGDDDARRYLRDLWETWWTLRVGEARLVLPADAWKMAAVRPTNHPHRRLGALAAVARAFPAVARAGDAAEFSRQLGALTHPFWNHQFNLACHRLARPAALIGPERRRDLVINAYLPSLPLSEGRDALAALPGPPPNERIRRAAEWIGGDRARELTRTALDQQGLLQLHEDFFPGGPQEIWDQFRGTDTP